MKMNPYEIAFAAIFWGVIVYAGFGYFWVPAETEEVRADRLTKHTKDRARFAELDRQECAIMLRAKYEMIPIEVERNKLYGMSDADAVRFANDDLADEEKLCSLLR